MSYCLEFSIVGLPRTINAIGRAHWAVKARHAKDWREAVIWAVRSSSAGIPKAPLHRADITLTRFSSGKIDYDGLVSSFKHVIDGLIDAKVLLDDDLTTIGIPKYVQEIAPRGRGKITVKVEEI